MRSFIRAFVKTNILSNTILSILSNFILHEIKTIDDKDSPWFINKMKTSFKRKAIVIKAIEIIKQ